MTTKASIDLNRASITRIVFALTGEKHDVKTEKRRGYWYAYCGPYEADKGVNGFDAENGAIEKLLFAIEREANEVQGVGMLKYRAECESSMARTEDYIAREVAKLQARLDAARHETAKYREETAAWCAKHCDDRARAVYDALTKYDAAT